MGRLLKSAAFAAIGAMAWIGSPSRASAQNLIGDPSFETPQGATNSEIGALSAQGTAWNAFNAVFLENGPATAEDGNQYIKVFGGGSGVFQDIPVTPGESYNASSWAQLPSSDHAAAGQNQQGQLLLIFRDPTNSNQVGATQVGETVQFGFGGTDSPASTWENSDLTGTVPAGVGFIRYQLNETASAGGSVFFDNASLTVTPAPEPCSIAVLAIGSLLGLRRRSRR